MITEGDRIVDRRYASEIGQALNADYCYYEMDEHENVTLVVKYGDFNEDSSSDDIVQHILSK